MNRRHFLGHAGAVSLAGLAATLGSIKHVQAADYKALVIVFLSGGHDGNNILIPTNAAYNDYAKARPSLASLVMIHLVELVFALNKMNRNYLPTTLIVSVS